MKNSVHYDHTPWCENETLNYEDQKATKHMTFYKERASVIAYFLHNQALHCFLRGESGKKILTLKKTWRKTDN